MFCCTLLYVHSSFAIILKLVALLSLSSWCLVIVVWLFLAVPWICLQFVIVIFPDHTHYLCSIKRTEQMLFKMSHSSLMESYPVRLDDECLVGTIIYFLTHTRIQKVLSEGVQL